MALIDLGLKRTHGISDVIAFMALYCLSVLMFSLPLASCQAAFVHLCYCSFIYFSPSYTVQIHNPLFFLSDTNPFFVVVVSMRDFQIFSSC